MPWRDCQYGIIKSSETKSLRSRLKHRWRRARDSNPRYGISAHTISSRAPSTTRTTLRKVDAKYITQTFFCQEFFKSPFSRLIVKWTRTDKIKKFSTKENKNVREKCYHTIQKISPSKRISTRSNRVFDEILKSQSKSAFLVSRLRFQRLKIL